MNLSHTRMGTLYIGIILYHLHENVNGSFKQKPIYEGNHHLLYAVEVNTLVDVPLSDMGYFCLSHDQYNCTLLYAD